jgi:hypothetical protein
MTSFTSSTQKIESAIGRSAASRCSRGQAGYTAVQYSRPIKISGVTRLGSAA